MISESTIALRSTISTEYLVGLGVLGALVLTMYIVSIIRSKDANQPLGLPKGSVRALLAVLIVGGFIVFLLLGSNIVVFDKILSAFATLTGSVIGFYFGHRSRADS